ncbi:MAG: TolC family protein, partial [Rikenellaceae bacterium]
DHSENLRELESLIKQSVMDLEASRAKYHTSQMNVKHQRTANQANQKKYQAGLLSIIDLLTSNNNLLLAQIELRNAYLRYQIQLRQVNFYKGIPYIQ